MTTLNKIFAGIVGLAILLGVGIYAYNSFHVVPQNLGGVYGTPAFNDYTDATLATTTLANYAGILHVIDVTTPIANSVITVYDAASTSTATTVVAKITVPSTATNPFELTFDNIFKSGLTVVQTGASSTITAEYQQN